MFEAIPKKITVPEQISNVIEKSILKGDMQIGNPLDSENSLSEQFETNRVSLRQALQILKSKGLIEGGQGKSWKIANYYETGNLELLPTLLEVKGICPETIQIVLDLLKLFPPLFTNILDTVVERAQEENWKELTQKMDDIEEGVKNNLSNPELLLLDVTWFETLLLSTNSVLYNMMFRSFFNLYKGGMQHLSLFWEPCENYPQPLLQVQKALNQKNKAKAKKLFEEYFTNEFARWNSLFQSFQ